MTEDEVVAIWEGLSGVSIFDGKRTFFVAFPGVKSKFGPDFKGAIIFVDGVRIEGDVECHIFSSDWFRHKHHADQNFSEVKIHVVWEEDVELDGITICLKKIREVNRGNNIFCSGVSERQKRDEILRCAFVRFLRKSERIKERISEVGDEQAIYEFIAEALGYERFKNFLLIFARMYHHEVLMNMSDIGATVEIFQNYLRGFTKKIPSRPQNFPERRIKQLSDFVKKNYPISQKVLEFFEEGRSYNEWEREFLVSGIGKGRFRTIIANVFIPYILIHKDVESVSSFFSSFPPEEMNRILKSGMKILNIAKVNILEAQGIIELFKSRCSRYLCYLCPLRKDITEDTK